MLVIDPRMFEGRWRFSYCLLGVESSRSVLEAGVSRSIIEG